MIGRLGTGCVVAVGTLASSLGPAWAAACTVCDSTASREVRKTLLAGEVGLNVLATVLPFVAVAGVVAAVHLGGPAKRRDDGNPRP